jgi:hypothetical protein
MAKAKATDTTGESNGAGNRRRNVQKGGFAVYRIVDMKDVSVNDDRGTTGFPADTCLIPAKNAKGDAGRDLSDTAAAMKWIRENAKDFDGANLLIVQEKSQVKPEVKKVEKVVLNT